MATNYPDSDRLRLRAEAAAELGLTSLQMRRAEWEHPHLRPLWLRGHAMFSPELMSEWRRFLATREAS